MSKGITRRKLINSFKSEMNAKNEAYAFILSKGLFEDFKFFCSVMSKLQIDAHALCMDILNEKANNLLKNQVEC